MTLELVPQAVAQDAGPFTFPGLYVDGQLGIGTPTPETLLNLVAASDPTIRLFKTGETTLDIWAGSGLGAFIDSDRGLTLDYGGGGDFRIREDGTQALRVTANRGLVIGTNTASTTSNFLLENGTNMEIEFQTTASNRKVEVLWNRNADKWRLGIESGSTSFFVKDDTTKVIEFEAGGNISIGTTGPGAKLHIDQASTAGAIPVLLLDQADVDEDYFKFIGTSDTSADRALVDAADFTTPGSIAGWLKINVQDDQATNPITDGDYHIPFYSVPTA